MRKAIFEHQGYIIYESPPPVPGEAHPKAVEFAKTHPYAQKTLYHVYDPEGKMVLGNRKSLEEAKGDLENYISTGGYKKWEKVGALLESKTTIQGYDIDPEIRSLIRDLNNSGFATIASCSGHGKERGFVNFEKPTLEDDEKGEIRAIFEALGVSQVNLVNAKDEYGNATAYFSL